MSFIHELLGLVGVRNIDRRKRYIIEQIHQIAPRFSKDGGGIRFDEDNCDWMMIDKYPLPARWEQRWTSLLIVFGAGYPETPPIGFHLSDKLELRNGQHDRHVFSQGHHGAPNVPGWKWV